MGSLFKTPEAPEPETAPATVETNVAQTANNVKQKQKRKNSISNYTFRSGAGGSSSSPFVSGRSTLGGK